MIPIATMMNRLAMIDSSISFGDLILIGNISLLQTISTIRTVTYTILQQARIKIKMRFAS